MPAHGHMMRPVVTLAPSSQAAYTVPATLAGTDTIVFVGAAVELSDSVRFASGFGADCTVSFEVWGVMAGRGGPGGNGGANGGSNPGSAPILAGGHGVFINQNVRTFFRFKGGGSVAGGGGGGGGGGGQAGHLGANSPGGGGGGGQGIPGGAHGNGGAGSPAGNNGTDGGSTFFGNGGAATNNGGKGGDGAGFAGVGWNGNASNPAGAAGGSGGQPGAAIYSVGFPAPVILEGNSAAHIKGAIRT